MDSASQMFFDELDRRFVPTGAQFDVTQWMKSLSYDTMGLMTFSRPYGYVQHGRDLHGIMDDVNRANLIIGPEEHRKSPKSPSNANVDGPIADCDFLGGRLHGFHASISGHPDALETVRAELRDKQRTATGLTLPFPQWHELQNLPFLDACIKESLRLDAPFAMPLERVVPAEGATICGHFYPGGTVVGMSPYITNRYKPTWGVDADQWRPSRLLEGEPSHTRKLEASLLSKSPGLGLSGGLTRAPPPARPVPECSDIVVVADIPPVPPIRPPDAVRNEPRASASTSSHLRHRCRRINELPPITLGHSVTCGCEDCRNRRFNRMTPMEEGWPELVR
ncbi:Cytochrome P450 [Penicillium italicum]|uniref:Cytochrome P450 n=1 Tax=Penicillium italicum TaxID=40296 RepID=A0A0A2KCG8_PENIT|nr:Cytochrome P450 [Penicillium italicum]